MLGTARLTVEEDTKIPNAATITIHKEDHTLANMLRSQLLQMDHVLFAGYKIPHPLEPRFIIKIQTDNESTPIQAVQEACKSLITTLAKMRDAFIKEFDTVRAMGGIASIGGDLAVGAGAGGAAAGGLNGTNEGLGTEGIFGSGAGAGLMDEGMGEY